MLVLARKPGQAIVLPELGIRIVVVEVRPGAVKIGIEAERRHTILREELVPVASDVPITPGDTVHVETRPNQPAA